jgi:hypothetical protein
MASLRRMYSFRLMRRSTTVLALATALAVPAASTAQEPAPVQSAVPGATPKPTAPQPAAGKISIKVRGGQRTRKLRYVASGGRVIISGTSRQFVPGQVAVLAIVRRGRVVATRRAPIRQAGSAGRVAFSFKARRRGTVRMYIQHEATPAQSAF